MRKNFEWLIFVVCIQTLKTTKFVLLEKLVPYGSLDVQCLWMLLVSSIDRRDYDNIIYSRAGTKGEFTLRTFVE